MNEILIARMQGPGPKKILARDGGGIRGMMTVEVLAQIGNLLWQKLGQVEDFVLADSVDTHKPELTGYDGNEEILSAHRLIVTAACLGQ